MPRFFCTPTTTTRSPMMSRCLRRCSMPRRLRLFCPGSRCLRPPPRRPPASVDEAAADPDEVPEQPESDSVTLQMPPDHTRLFEDQAHLLRSLLRTRPLTSRGPNAKKPGRGPSPWLSRWCVSRRCVRPGRQRRQPDPSNAVELRRLYRRNCRCAVQHILEGPPQTCAILLQDLQNHFGHTWSARQADSTLLLRRDLAPAGVHTSNFSTDEVATRRPPGVVRVYKIFLACHCRPGRQCLLATSTGPGSHDHIATVVGRAYRPGHQVTGTWTSTDVSFQSSRQEKTPSGNSKSVQAFSCLSLPVRSLMPTGDTNGPRSSWPPRPSRCPGLPTRMSVHVVLPPGGVPAWPSYPPLATCSFHPSRSPRVPVTASGVPLRLRG
ncbi:hypothetical protein MRX96_042225 [Rhipicephalus microplus]